MNSSDSSLQPPLIHNNTSLYVGPSPGKGRGVFSSRAIPAGERIERCPLILVPSEQLVHVDRTVLYNYYFGWSEGNRDGALACGYAMLYNHSYRPNARYVKVLAEQVVDFVAVRDIAPGEEITVNYNNGDPDDQRPLWFSAID